STERQSRWAAFTCQANVILSVVRDGDHHLGPPSLHVDRPSTEGKHDLPLAGRDQKHRAEACSFLHAVRDVALRSGARFLSPEGGRDVGRLKRHVDLLRETGFVPNAVRGPYWSANSVCRFAVWLIVSRPDAERTRYRPGL